MTRIALTVALMTLTALAVLQVLVAGGAPLGRFTQGGQADVLAPGQRMLAVVSLVLYAVFALIMLSRAGVLPGANHRGIRIAAWVLCGFFVLSIIPNAISRSASERAVMTPVSALLALCAAVIARAHD